MNEEALSSSENMLDADASGVQGRPLGVTVLALYHLVVGGVSLIAAIGLALALTAGVIGADFRNPDVVGFASAFGAFSVLGAVTGIYLIGTGYGLWKLRKWGRITALLFAGLSLLAIPVGTAIGGVTLGYLLLRRTASAFRV